MPLDPSRDVDELTKPLELGEMSRSLDYSQKSENSIKRRPPIITIAHPKMHVEGLVFLYIMPEFLRHSRHRSIGAQSHRLTPPNRCSNGPIVTLLAISERVNQQFGILTQDCTPLPETR